MRFETDTLKKWPTVFGISVWTKTILLPTKILFLYFCINNKKTKSFSTFQIDIIWKECVIGPGRNVVSIPNDETVIITSPNFPDNYNINERIEWNLQTQGAASWIRVEVDSFNASHKRNLICNCKLVKLCSLMIIYCFLVDLPKWLFQLPYIHIFLLQTEPDWDFVELFQEGFAHCEAVSDVTHTLSGNAVTQGTAFVLTGNQATIVFVSDSWNAVGSFRLAVTAVPEGNHHKGTCKQFFFEMAWFFTGTIGATDIVRTAEATGEGLIPRRVFF